MAISLLASLSGGMLAALSACRLRLVAWKFVRLVGIVAFVLIGAVVILRMRGGMETAAEHWALALSLGGAAAAFAIMVLAPLVERFGGLTRVLCALGGLAGMAAGCAWSIAPSGVLETGWTARGAGILGGQVAGSLLLGAVTVAWMLGHAYLTATAMTIAPLRTLSRLLVATVVLRVGYVAVSLAVLWMAADGGGELGRVLASSWPALTLRIGAGLVLLGVFAYMVLDCVRLRSTQSATGILYFASVLAYVGELSSQYLVAEWQWPL